MVFSDDRGDWNDVFSTRDSAPVYLRDFSMHRLFSGERCGARAGQYVVALFRYSWVLMVLNDDCGDWNDVFCARDCGSQSLRGRCCGAGTRQ